MNHNILVVGSGLSAVAAIKALVSKGIKPTVLDTGETLEDDKKVFTSKLASMNPCDWCLNDREALTKNDTIKGSSKIPKKLVFGSDFLYGQSSKIAPVESIGSLPPFSYAKGGLSVGWGAAILPPHKKDILDWPIEIEEFHKYCRIVLQDLPYSSDDDGLSLSFPQMNKQNQKLQLSSRAKFILNKLQKNVQLKKDDVLYGQARLLVNTSSNDGCKYCGECMSGCVYKSIYKSDGEIETLEKNGKINYISGALVDKVIEKDNQVVVEFFDTANQKKSFNCEKVFLAAGAVNSTRIILNSLEKYDENLTVKTRGGFVIPVFSFKSLPIDWPKVNTQPSLFVEFKGKNLKHWVHTQVASDNELLLKMLGVRNQSNKGFLAKLKKWIAQHTYLLLVNYHSDYSGIYELKLEKSTINILKTKHKKAYPQISVWIRSWMKLFGILVKIGSIPMYPFAKLNSGSYHVGGTIPMKKEPKELETDVLGRVTGMKNVHIVDTSIFPSLPGTTIGLMMMANSYRIVDKIFQKKNED